MDRDALPRGRVHGERTREGSTSRVPIASRGGTGIPAPFDEVPNVRFVLLLGQGRQGRVARRNGQEGHAEQRVDPRGERRQGQARLGHLEVDLDALGASDPIALQPLRYLRPVQLVQCLQHLVGVGGDPKKPLLHDPFGHQGPAPFAPVPFELLECKHGAARWAPHDRRLPPDGQARPVQLQEHPLGPPVIGRVTGDDLVPPRPSRTQASQLPAVVGHGLPGQRPRVLSHPEREVLRVDAERIEPHGLKYPAPVHPLESAEHVGAAVRVGMADVQPLRRRIGELHQVVERVLGGNRVDVDLVQARLLPPGLPSWFDLLGVVSVVHRSLLPGKGKPPGRQARGVRRAPRWAPAV